MLKQDWSIIPLVHMDRAILYILGSFFWMALLAREINIFLIGASVVWVFIGIASGKSLDRAQEKWGYKLFLFIIVGAIVTVCISRASVGIFPILPQSSSVLDNIDDTIWTVKSTAENWGATFLVIYGLAIVPFKTMLSLTKDFRDVLLYGKKKIPKKKA